MKDKRKLGRSVRGSVSLPQLQRLKASHRKISKPSAPVGLSASLKFKYHGDLFGTRGDYSQAVLYRSRIPQLTVLEEAGSITGPVVKVRQRESRTEKRSRGREVARMRQCAASIEAMAANELLHENLLKDGIAQSIFALCGTGDLATVKSCTAALCYLTAGQCGAGREALLRNGCVTVLRGVLKKHPEESITHNCLATISNLTIEDGFESILVKEKMMGMLQRYNNHSESVEYFCAMALFNMTCSSYSYARIEEVIETIVRMTIKQSIHHCDLMSKALFNLASNKMNQDKVREQDALSVLNSLSSSIDPVVRSNALQSFFYLSSNPSCRNQLAICGCVEPLIAALSNPVSQEELHYTLLTLQNLSWDIDATIRMGFGGIFDELNKIVEKSDNLPLFSCVYGIIANLLRIPWNKQYVNEPFLEFILYANYTSQDALNLLFAISRLTADDNMEQWGHLSDTYPELQWVQTPRMGTLVQDHKYLARFVSYATDKMYSVDGDQDYLQAVLMHNLCILYPVRNLHQAFFPKLQRIADENQRQDIKQLGAETLAEICTDKSLHPTLMDGGLVEVLVSLLAAESDIITCLCLETICTLFDEQTILDFSFIVQQIFPILVRLCPRGNSNIRARCSACFMRFLVVEECRPDMVKNGLISSLALMSSDSDPKTLLQCVNAYSRLSCDAEICKEMIENGIVKSLTTLSAAPEEFVRRACAIAFCNLSYSEENMTPLVKKGTLPALLVIACVKTTDNETRQLCMKAVINLMRDESNLAQMCAEGLPWAFAVFAENVNSDDADLVASAFCRLAHSPISRPEISRTTVINSFIQMLRSEASVETKTSILKGMLNSLEESNRLRASKLLIHSSFLEVCIDLLGQGMDQYIAELTTVLYDATWHYSLRHDETLRFQTVIAMLLRHPNATEHVKYCCAVAIHRMSLEIHTADDLINENRLLKIAINEINSKNSDRVVSLLMRIMYNVSCVHEQIENVAAMGVVDAISFIVNSRPDELESLKMCGAIVRNLTSHSACLQILVDDGGISLLDRLFHTRDRGCKEDSAIAACNIILGNINSKKVLQDGGLESVLWLMINHDINYVRLASAALRRLATPKGNLEFIINQDAIPVVAALLDGTDDLVVIENTAAALCLFSSRREARPILATYGSISFSLEKISQYDMNSLNATLRQIFSDLMSNLASFVRPDAESEKKVASTLLKLSQSTDLDQGNDWVLDRAYMQRGVDDSLPIPSISEERKLAVEDSPTITLEQYMVTFGGYRIDFSASAACVDRHEICRVAPDNSILREKLDQTTVVDFVKNRVSGGKSKQWRKLAKVEFSHKKRYAKITEPNHPIT